MRSLCWKCKKGFNRLKSVRSSQESKRSTPSGRSNFPANAEVEMADLLPDLGELSDRVNREQLDRLKAVLESTRQCLPGTKPISDVQHRID